jgi:hypothetical protein
MNVTSKTKSPYALETAAMDAANSAGVRLYNLRQSGRSGIAFTLKTGEHAEPRIDWRGKVKLSPRYQRLSQRTERSVAKGFEGVEYQKVVPGAVCWHGHAAFLKAFYALVPDAKIRTALTTYKNAAHFAESYPETYYGPPAAKERAGFAYVNVEPYGAACACEK